MYYIFLWHAPRQAARNSKNQCTDLLNIRILNSIIVPLPSRLQLPPKEGNQVVISDHTFQPSHPYNLYMVTTMSIGFLHITINYAFFRTFKYITNALKKQCATFTILKSPTLNVTFHHPSLLFTEQKLQQIYISNSSSVKNAKQESQWSLAAKLLSSNHHIHIGKLLTADGPP
jgi:hypothetical protein